MRSMDRLSCLLSVLIVLLQASALASAALSGGAAAHGHSRVSKSLDDNDVPKLKTLDEIVTSARPRTHVSKISKVTYADIEDDFNDGPFRERNHGPIRESSTVPAPAQARDLTDEEKTNREIGKAIQFMRVISQVDNFLASKAKELLKSMHNMIDDKGSLGALLSTADQPAVTSRPRRTPWSLMDPFIRDIDDEPTVTPRNQWAKRDVGKPDPDVQARRIQELERAKKFMQIVGQVDAYVSDRAKTLLKSLHNIIDNRQGTRDGFSNRI